METRTLNVDDIYFAALGRESAEERSAYLKVACSGNSELRRRVERLLQAQANIGSFLEVRGDLYVRPGIDTRRDHEARALCHQLYE